MSKSKELFVPKMVTSRQVVTALRIMYPSDRYAFIEQVGNSTGFRVKGWADAVAIGLWPSRGIDIIGIEVKVSRQDWKAELRDAAKAENIARFCDYWYLAVGDESIVHDGELPTNWGLIAPKSETELKIIKAAEKNPSPELDRGFIAAVLRRVATPDAEALKEEFRRGRDEARKEFKRDERSHDGLLETQLRDYQRLKKVCEEFEQASGVNLLHEWDGKKIGEAVRAIAHDHAGSQLGRLRHVAREAAAVAEVTSKSLKAVEEALL